MKNNHYFYWNKTWIMLILWLFAGCYDSDSWVNVVEEPAKVQVTLTAEEAQASFENEIMNKTTRSISTRKEDLFRFSKHQFPFGNIVPKWNCGVASNASGTAYYETSIRSSYFFRAWRHKRIGKNKKKKWMCTKIIHKLLVMKDLNTNETYNYIELLIPTIHFINHHRTFNFSRITNDGNMMDFSGFKLYTTLDGHLVRVNEYKKGKRVRGVFLDGTTDKETYQEMRRRALNMLRNTRISIKLPKAVVTRSYDELEYEDETWYTDDEGNMWVWDSYLGDWTLVGNINGEDGEKGYIIDEVVITPDPDPESEIDDPFIPSPIPPIEGGTNDDLEEEGIGGGGGGSSSIGSGGGSSTPVAPKAKTIFRNSSMTETNWKVIERMLGKIIADCMGQALYNGLKNSLNGKTLIIKFIDEEKAGFVPDKAKSGIKLGLTLVNSNILFHEMWHVYQAYHESETVYLNSLINQEIEAHYAQYLYVRKLPEYRGSKWESYYAKDKRHRAIKGLSDHIDGKGNLRPGKNVEEFNFDILSIASIFETTDGYDDPGLYKYDDTRSGLSNFSNLRTLTKDC